MTAQVYAAHLQLLDQISPFFGDEFPGAVELLAQIRQIVADAGSSTNVRIGDWKSAVAELGCLICDRPAQLHHPRADQGMSQRANDALVVPLCKHCHQIGTSFAWPSIHGAPRDFYAKHRLTEMDLVAITLMRMLPRLELRQCG